MEMVGWAHGDCVSWIGNYTGANIKFRRWLGGPNRSLVLNYGDGRVGPWGLCIMDRELYRSLILNSGGGWVGPTGA